MPEPEAELELVLEEPGPEELDLPTLAVTAPVGYLTLDGDTSTPVTLDGQQLEPPWHHLQVPVGKHVLAWRGKKKTLTIHEGKTSRAVLK